MSTSPEITRNVSSSSTEALRTEPAVPSGRVLGGVPHRDAEVGAVAEVVADLVRRGTRRSRRCRRSRARASSVTMCSSIGRLTSGIIGFGWLLVSGRSRVPSPPARMTAFTLAPPRSPGAPPVASLAQRAACERDVDDRGAVAEHEAHDRDRPRGDLEQVVEGPRTRVARASRKPGNANISANVPALPTHWTSMRRAPAAASASVATLTTASRASTATPNHVGTAPSIGECDRPR